MSSYWETYNILLIYPNRDGEVIWGKYYSIAEEERPNGEECQEERPNKKTKVEQQKKHQTKKGQ